jgi:UDP-2,3-diacylglucosamine hydrolase
VATLFVSDLHLDASRPAATQAFLEFLQTDGRKAARLYILGDLFEYWVADEDPNPHHRKVKEALAELTATGTRCYIMHGNRDFLLGTAFTRETGTKLLYDPTLIYVGNESVLISHGDFLCTDDISYQRFRKVVRSQSFAKLYGVLPLSMKMKLAETARNRSRASHAQKPPEIMDVNQAAVIKTMTNYSVATLLHGHTHRPGIHQFEIAGHQATRIVLGDWYEQGNVLTWDQHGPRLQTMNF